MKIRKPKSKRTPVRLRHKIEKASAAKQRKDRKLAKKNPEWRSRLKKDPGIPNLFPYKDKLLGEIEEKKRLKQEEAARLKEEARARRQASTAEENGGEEAMEESRVEEDEDPLDDEMEEDDIDEVYSITNPMAALLASAMSRAAEYAANGADSADEMEEDGDEDEDEWGGFDSDVHETPESHAGVARKDPSRKTFDKIFKQVLESADVILYVLDARDPEGTRSKEVERTVMASDGGEKRLILVLNKIDLVPPTVLKGWLVHLRRYFPTIPLRASGPAPNAHTFNHRQLTVQNTSATLLKALKSYAHSKKLKRAVSVGVIGYPNVGKSSVINILTSRLGGSATACPVGAEAGVTTSLREVKLDSKLKLLDSPGIVFPSADSPAASRTNEQSRLILLNAVPPKQIEDPIPAVSLLLKRLSVSEELFSKLLEVYGLPPLLSSNGDPTTDFLIQVARKRGRLSKGGVPNIGSAATTVITDWRDGRIQGWISPPKLQLAAAGETGAGDQKEVVTEWAKEFKLEGLWGDGEEDGNDEMMVDRY
ncbi:hypothetical protein GP486_005963 [Trichoglossum hirsutum]|uniref:CP-type G domain-containing protein n=1 Tax=Trichoglossum hirsutum TaxID=265104 RepID=A0A9P8RLA6_9PEZI|nr:hypothetical protein GP486_005963 [Trichoglossum hirsutum]